jgi:hypothetical protein
LGVYRFLLAIGVVAFHVGGGWVIGRPQSLPSIADF